MRPEESILAQYQRFPYYPVRTVWLRRGHEFTVNRDGVMINNYSRLDRRAVLTSAF
jgi:hypothetical protein